MHKLFRGKVLDIEVKNPEHKQSGVKELLLDGTKLDSNYIPADKLKDTNNITIVLG